MWKNNIYFKFFRKSFYTNFFFSTHRVQFQQTSTISSLEFSKGPAHLPKNSKCTNIFRKVLRNCFSGGDEWSFGDNADFYCSISKKNNFFFSQRVPLEIKEHSWSCCRKYGSKCLYFHSFSWFLPAKIKKNRIL